MKDLFTEKKGGKVSSKKFWGNIFLNFVVYSIMISFFMNTKLWIVLQYVQVALESDAFSDKFLMIFP